jgi:hypothetical protein
MSLCAGIGVRRKRSEVAVVDDDDEVLANRHVPNGVELILRVTSGLPCGTRGVRDRLGLGVAGAGCWRTTGSTRTWFTRCSARRSARRGRGTTEAGVRQL